MEDDREGPLLAVSPHLDDAVMSVGATLAALAAAGREVVVYTVFAGHPTLPLSSPAMEFHADCGLGDDAVAVRLAEDRAAVEALGAVPLYGPFLDALYRRLAGDWLCAVLGDHFDPQLAEEPELLASVTGELRELVCTRRPAAVWTCSGIGGHVDHRIVRSAAEAACAEEAVELAVWEDLPYALGRDIADVDPDGVIRIAGAPLDGKLDAIAAYPSQLRMLFADGFDWRAAFDRHARARQLAHRVPELIWRVSI